MEPVNFDPVSGDSEGDARLEALLRAPQPALPESDFTSRVLAALPERTAAVSTASTRWSRATLCGVAATFGVLTALAGVAPWSDWNAVWAPVVDAFAPAANWLADSVVLTSLVVAIGSSVYALRWPVRRTAR